MTTQITPGTWTIDAAHTSVGFQVRHLAVSKVRGTFDEVTGTIDIAEAITDSKVNGAVQVASINTRNEARDEHLRSGDFFAADEHPQITFTSTAVEGEGEQLRVAGDFTMRGVTKPVTFDVEIGGVLPDNGYGQQVLGFEATTTINRKDFGVSFNVATEAGGLTLGEDIKIIIEGEATQAVA